MYWKIILEVKHTLAPGEFTSICRQYPSIQITEERSDREAVIEVIVKRSSSRGAMAFVISLFAGHDSVTFCRMTAKPMIGYKE